MGPETKVTLLAVGVIVAAIAIELIGITINLRKASLALRGVQRGVGTIRTQTEPVGDVLGEIATETGTIAGALTALVVKATGASTPVPQRMQDAVARAMAGDVPPEVPIPPPPGSMREAVARARTGGSDGPAPDEGPGSDPDPFGDGEGEVGNADAFEPELTAESEAEPVFEDGAPPRHGAAPAARPTRARSATGDGRPVVRRRRRPPQAGNNAPRAPMADGRSGGAGTGPADGGPGGPVSMSEAVARAREAVSSGAP